MQSGKLENIKIAGIHGYKCLDVNLQENTLVLVGENGSGKTTFLRTLFALLSGRWADLLQIQFSDIRITIDSASHTVDRTDIEAFMKGTRKYPSMLLKYLPTHLVRQIEVDLGDASLDEFPNLVEQLSKEFDIPRGALLREFDRIQLQRSTSAEDEDERADSIRRIRRMHSAIQSALSSQILYLPTYRRIERELQAILKDVDTSKAAFGRRYHQTSNDRECIELVEFGMKDVQAAIERTVAQIKEFARESLNSLTLNYLGDVVNREYAATDLGEIRNASAETVQAVLDRIHEHILTDEHKNHLASILRAANEGENQGEIPEHQQILIHYFSKLLRFQEALRTKERAISEFCDLCSNYIVDKRFYYDSPASKFSILPTSSSNQGSVELSELSSGEKQIVSLFSHLYLSGHSNYFVLIDEPELSLSVPWQRRFLVDIRKGAFCSGLVAATHSPFIYDNSLRSFAHALGEFTDY